MNSFQYLKKLEELEMAMEEVVSKAHEVFGTVPESEFTERLYSMMHEVKDLVEEIENEDNEIEDLQMIVKENNIQNYENLNREELIKLIKTERPDLEIE